MEANGFKRQLQEALDYSKSIKLLFQYPAAARAVKKSGRVVSVDEDSFTMDEIYDGEVTLSYKFLVELVILNG